MSCSIALYIAKHPAWGAKGTGLVSQSNKRSTADQVCCKVEGKEDRKSLQDIPVYIIILCASIPHLVSPGTFKHCDNEHKTKQCTPTQGTPSTLLHSRNLNLLTFLKCDPRACP